MYYITLLCGTRSLMAVLMYYGRMHQSCLRELRNSAMTSSGAVSLHASGLRELQLLDLLDCLIAALGTIGCNATNRAQQTPPQQRQLRPAWCSADGATLGLLILKHGLGHNDEAGRCQAMCIAFIYLFHLTVRLRACARTAQDA
jgi:hypothetical protein